LTIENLQNHFNFDISVFNFSFLTKFANKSRLLIHDTYAPTGFVLRILWCSQSGDHPENKLAKFKYILDMEVGKKKTESLYILGYILELIIEIWRIWVIFSMKNPLHRSKSYFSGRILAKIRQ
jgi:hypothetical protein